MIMKIITLLSAILLTLSTNIFAQPGRNIFTQPVAINTTGADADASAMLDVSSTKRGFLLPRMTELWKTKIISPATGLLVFQTDGTSGFYYFTGTHWQAINPAPPPPTSYAIGDHALGGIVFYVNADGTHGLVAAAQNQFTSNWYEAHDNLNNPTYHDTEGDKYFDWRLPTKYELNLMYLQKATIGFASGTYWSSTEDAHDLGGPSITAWERGFPSGRQYGSGKHFTYFVRAVRAF